MFYVFNLGLRNIILKKAAVRVCAKAWSSLCQASSTDAFCNCLSYVRRLHDSKIISFIHSGKSFHKIFADVFANVFFEWTLLNDIVAIGNYRMRSFSYRRQPEITHENRRANAEYIPPFSHR